MIGLLAISRAFRPSEPRWQQMSITTVHRAVPVPPQLGPIPTTGIVIWTPPFPCFIRGFTLNDESADPLVGAGGATLLSVGNISAPNELIAASGLATYANCNGWGVSGPRVNDTVNVVADSGMVLFPSGSVPGRAAAVRTLIASSNAGTITGTLRFRFEMRAFPGAW